MDNGEIMLRHGVSSMLKSLFLLSLALPFTAQAASSVTFDVAVHVQDYGNLTFAEDEWAGTIGESKRLEAFTIQPIKAPEGTWPDCLALRYMAHIQGTGDTGWYTAPANVGTAGRSLRIEGVAFRTAGTCANRYTVEYRCHLQDLGTSALMKDGEFCGTRGQERRLEAIQVTVRRK
jgi:uncharacterized protein YjdB